MPGTWTGRAVPSSSSSPAATAANTEQSAFASKACAGDDGCRRAPRCCCSPRSSRIDLAFLPLCSRPCPGLPGELRRRAPRRRNYRRIGTTTSVGLPRRAGVNVLHPCPGCEILGRSRPRLAVRVRAARSFRPPSSIAWTDKHPAGRHRGDASSARATPCLRPLLVRAPPAGRTRRGGGTSGSPSLAPVRLADSHAARLTDEKGGFPDGLRAILLVEKRAHRLLKEPRPQASHLCRPLVLIPFVSVVYASVGARRL
eukprot:296256-Chlamydomonas_euryale.AAC.1